MNTKRKEKEELEDGYISSLEMVRSSMEKKLATKLPPSVGKAKGESEYMKNVTGGLE